MGYKDIIDGAMDTTDSWNSTSDLERFFVRLLDPSIVQNAEFGQHVALTQYLNNDAIKDRYNAMRDLGINPATAAASLGSSSSASPPNSAIGAQADILKTGAAVADSVGNVADKLASARETRELLDERKKNLISDTFLKYISAGYTDEMAKGLAIANAYLPTEKFLGLISLQSSIDNLHVEYYSIMQSIEESKSRIREIDAQIQLAESQRNLNEKLSLEAEKRTLEIEARTKEQNWLNEKMSFYDINPRNPIESNIFLSGVRDGKSSYDSQLGIIRDIRYNEATGNYDANQEHAYSISRDTALGHAFASWFSRPSSTASLVSDGVKKVVDLVKNGKVSQKDALSNIKSNNQFLRAFNEFKFQMKRDVDAKRKAYKDAKRFNNNIEAANKWREYQQSLSAYDDFDEEDFANLLMNNFNNFK